MIETSFHELFYRECLRQPDGLSVFSIGAQSDWVVCTGCMSCKEISSSTFREETCPALHWAEPDWSSDASYPEFGLVYTEAGAAEQGVAGEASETDFILSCNEHTEPPIDMCIHVYMGSSSCDGEPLNFPWPPAGTTAQEMSQREGEACLEALNPAPEYSNVRAAISRESQSASTGFDFYEEIAIELFPGVTDYDGDNYPKRPHSTCYEHDGYNNQAQKEQQPMGNTLEWKNDIKEFTDEQLANFMAMEAAAKQAAVDQMQVYLGEPAAGWGLPGYDGPSQFGGTAMCRSSAKAQFEYSPDVPYNTVDDGGRWNRLDESLLDQRTGRKWNESFPTEWVMDGMDYDSYKVVPELDGPNAHVLMCDCDTSMCTPQYGGNGSLLPCYFAGYAEAPVGGLVCDCGYSMCTPQYDESGSEIFCHFGGESMADRWHLFDPPITFYTQQEAEAEFNAQQALVWIDTVQQYSASLSWGRCPGMPEVQPKYEWQHLARHSATGAQCDVCADGKVIAPAVPLLSVAVPLTVDCAS